MARLNDRLLVPEQVQRKARPVRITAHHECLVESKEMQ